MSTDNDTPIEDMEAPGADDIKGGVPTPDRLVRRVVDHARERVGYDGPPEPNEP